MGFAFRKLVALIGLLSVLASAAPDADSAQAPAPAPKDACAAIGGKTWVAPKDVRACYQSVKLDPKIKSNVIEVVNKTLAFHSSVNYQIQAPAPFNNDVHEDLAGDLAKISHTNYDSEYDFHIAVSRMTKRLNDGHCVWVNACYDSMFVNYLPIPLSLLVDSRGKQDVYIAKEAFTVASAEFADGIDFWQNSLPGNLKGQLASLSGAKVLTINGEAPFNAVNANAAIAGSYQGLGTRQNGYFSSYQRSSGGWNYLLGNFAQQALPLDDQVTLTILRVNQTRTETVTIPYHSRIGASSIKFNDTTSWRSGNCLAQPDTNGFDAYSDSFSPTPAGTITPVQKYQQQPLIASSQKKHLVNVMLDDTPLTDVVLPPQLIPGLPVLDGSQRIVQFYMLDDGKTGVMALGSFSDGDYDTFLNNLVNGLVNLKKQGATRLIADVSNNGGGWICAAHYLHRVISGPKSTTEPQPGLDTKTRAGPLAKLIVKTASDGGDPQARLLYNPINWSNANNTRFGANENWLDPSVDITVNGKKDSFSQRLGQECTAADFPTPPPEEALFDGSQIAIVSNGRCASSCSLFSITLSKEEGAKTVVIGGKQDVQQQYCGTVGGQSTDFETIDSEIKTAQLKDHELAPPDLLVNGVLGITWRLGFGVENTQQPEEWQNHPADINLPITSDLANNPLAIWKAVADRVWN
ncbi:hypothetical protein BDN72DRAFT_871423 [Pluteus cervinus]|uniref:Uncharacterized protein n=1 Tax=Pluteus cervinus TaxID=181527 RepID=A0ACD3APP7_9AGAR|nr:hypothetical protein BDN72DRAFT_871423 [Pluteus cervinus]